MTSYAYGYINLNFILCCCYHKFFCLEIVIHLTKKNMRLDREVNRGPLYIFKTAACNNKILFVCVFVCVYENNASSRKCF